MIKKAVIAGGTGFIGRFLEEKYAELDYEVKIISRQSQHISWQDPAGIVQALENAQILINLAGKSVDCRYNRQNKAEIFKSRTETTKILGNALLACAAPPPLWINSSTATIYRHAEDRPMTEETGEIGSGFSVEVAKAWEQAFMSFQLPQTRQAALRMAIVLGKGGGVMTPFQNLVKWGLGGVQGSGKQQFSWIHLSDLWHIIRFLQVNGELSGVFNCSAPEPVTNRELMKHFRQAMKARIGLPSPQWLLAIGAVFLRTEPELILKSRWVIPDRLERAGYTFKFPEIGGAIRDILNDRKV